jgi:DUF1009 family protein
MINRIFNSDKAKNNFKPNINQKMRIGLIAGSGQFPLLLAKEAQKREIEIYAAAFIGEADPVLKETAFNTEWLHLGQLKKLITYFKKNKITQALMAGAIKKTKIFTDIKPDIKAISMIIGMRHTNDDAVLRAFATTLEKEGIKIMPSTYLMPELLAEQGCWTKKKPSKNQKKDIQLGFQIAKKIGELDIGQCVVIGGGSVLAIEAIEGTDAAIKRGGELGKGAAVAIKTCKPNQDMRFDVPAVGVNTINKMKQSGVQALAIEAGKTIAFDKEQMINIANEAKISIIAL